MSKDKRICICVTDDEMVAFKALALYEGRSVSAITRFALIQYGAVAIPNINKIANEFVPFVPQGKYGALKSLDDRNI